MKTKLVKVESLDDIKEGDKFCICDGGNEFKIASDEFNLVREMVNNGKLLKVVEGNWWEDVPEEGMWLRHVIDGGINRWGKSKIEEYFSHNSWVKCWEPLTQEHLDDISKLIKTGDE